MGVLFAVLVSINFRVDLSFILVMPNRLAKKPARYLSFRRVCFFRNIVGACSIRVQIVTAILLVTWRFWFGTRQSHDGNVIAVNSLDLFLDQVLPVNVDLLTHVCRFVVIFTVKLGYSLHGLTVA